MSSLLSWMRPYRLHYGLGVIMLVATNMLGYMVPKLIKAAIDAVGVDQALLSKTAGLVFVIATLQACVRIASRLLIFNAARDIEGNMRRSLFQHVLGWSPERLRAHPLGDLQSRMLNDLTNVRLLFGAGLLNIVNTGIAYIVALPLLYSESAKLMAVALIPYPFMFVLMMVMGKRIFKDGIVVGERLGKLSNLINEDLGARLYITASGIAKMQEDRFATANDDYREVNLRLVRTRSIMFPLMSVLGSIGIALALLFGGDLVLAGAMSIGSLVAFTSYLSMLTFPTMMLGFMLALFQRGRASWQRVAELFTEPLWTSVPGQTGSGAPDMIAPHLSVHQLSVRRGDKDAISALDLEIPFGERLGLVGEVGSGKTTLLTALARQVELSTESYHISGTPVNSLDLNAVRRLIGMVSQQPFLFSMSVRDNLTLGALHARPAELTHALDTAQIKDEMERLPQGLDTEIGERGVTISGGQKQRLALARAIASDPKVLLLDDCFSAVDVETEKRIIDKLMHGGVRRTIVIATHRLAVLDHVDRVVVLEGGKIIEQGSPQELQSRAGSRYRALCERQRLAERIGEAA